MSGLGHPLLSALGVDHAFGTRDAPEPAGLLRPRQVHGTGVIVLAREVTAPALLGEADAVVSEHGGLPIGVVTADCLPILVATPCGRVAAVHAGWRGLAAGVIGAALVALGACAPRRLAGAVAVIGPRIGRGCYEVDAPVMEALARRFADALPGARTANRPGHWQLDLAALARVDLARAGLAEERIATLSDACTACDAERFHSYRRDGPGAGRLVHWIAARPERPTAHGVANGTHRP